MKKFYVYQITDPRNGNPIYIGKGSRERRSKVHLGQNGHNQLLSNIISKIREEGLEPLVETVAVFETEREAFDKERELIAKIGRRVCEEGTLANFSVGGEGPSGAIYSEEVLAKKRKLQLELSVDPIVAEKKRIKSTENWQDEEVRAKRSAGIKIALNRQSYKSTKAKETAAFWKDEEHRAMRCEAISKARNKFTWFVNGVEYFNAASAAKANSVSIATIHNWVDNDKATKKPII